ncbi:MAG: cytidylyltransferase domain-containing protein [Clostridium sp.]
MYKGYKILGIIPARSGSKGIKNKNIKDFCGKPLLCYSIIEGINSGIFDEIVLSSDSESYGKIGESYGISFKKRSEELSGDRANVCDMIVELLGEYRDYDYFVVLQPTSPLRMGYHIKEAMDLLIANKCSTLVSVSEWEHNISLNVERDNSGLITTPKGSLGNRQEMGKSYRINGAIYIGSVLGYLKDKTLYTSNTYGYIMDRKHSIDIDSIEDFEYGEFIYGKEMRGL